jgi:hypothetical protein
LERTDPAIIWSRKSNNLEGTSMKKKLKRIYRRVHIKMMTQHMRWRYRARSLPKTFEPLIAQAKGLERQSLVHDYYSQLIEIDLERRSDSDQKLIRRAHSLNVPIPTRQEQDGLWEECQGSLNLTEKGTHHLLKAIQAKRTERLALWKAQLTIFEWSPVIIGLIVVLIGLVSVLRK